MKRGMLISVIFIFLGCSGTISEKDLQGLNGYWEIDEVEFPDGRSKEYNVNTTIDYIEINGLKGFRKKVQPQLDGTFKTTDDAEPFNIVEREGTFKMHYKNELSEWTERVIEISENGFSVVNEDDITYKYKRYEPIKLND